MTIPNPPASSVPQLSLQQLKDLYAKGMAHARKKFSSAFYPKYDKLCDYQLKLVSQAKDLTTMMNAVWIQNPVWSTAFIAPKPLCAGCELGHTAIQFGVGTIEWYFFYGISGDYVYNISFFKQEIAPQEVVDSVISDRSEAVRWNVVGGCGLISTQSWYPIQSEYIYMKYTQPTYSTFSLVGAGNNITVNLQSNPPLQFSFDITYNSPDNKPHSLSVGTQARTGPTPNFPNSCECGLGLGTMYYSYTDMTAVAVIDGGTAGLNGTAWMDHQLIKGGIPDNWYWQAVETVGNVLSPKKSAGWLWTTIQDYESGLQYMFVHGFGSKFYQDDISMNKKIPNQTINVYKEGVTRFTPSNTSIDSSDFQMEVVESIAIPAPINMNLPKRYKITLPGGKLVYLQIATAPNVYTTAPASYECPSILLDSTGVKPIGIGLIEANLYITNRVLAQRLVQYSGGNPTDEDQVNTVLTGIEGDQSNWNKFLAFLVALIPMWLLLSALFFVLYKKDQRKNRIMLSLAVLLIIYGAWKVLIPSA